MRSQGLPSSFLLAHLGINYHPPPPLVVLSDGFVSAGIPQCSRRSARHLANPRSSCSRREVERLPPSVSAILIQVLSLGLLMLVSLPHERDMRSMLCASADRGDGGLPSP